MIKNYITLISLILLYDEFLRYNKEKLHKIANDAVKKFLDLWII